MHNVSIWRNGMLITRKHRGFHKTMFGGKKPLNAVIVLSGKENPKNAHDLVRKAETPLHDRIQENRLSTSKEQRELKSLLEDIRKWITQYADDSGGESTYLEDEIMLDAGSAEAFRSTSYISRTKIEDDTTDDDAVFEGENGHEINEGTGILNNTNGEGKRGKRTVSRKEPAPVQIQGQVHGNKCRVRLIPNEDTQQALLEILIDTGQDPSCVGGIGAKHLIIKKAEAVPPNKDVNCIEGKVRIANLKKDSPFFINLEFELPLPKNVSLECRVNKIHHE